jgi:capsid protein
MDMTKPTMSLNSELYAGGQDIWSSNYSQARHLSRIAHTQSPAAQALVGRFVDMIYGSKLELQSSPVWDMIPKAPKSLEERQKIVKNIEQRYRLFAKSKKSDYTQELNLFRRSRTNLEKLLIDGEYFVLLRYNQSRKRNPLTIQNIPPENIMRVDSLIQRGNTEADGIEYDNRGVAVAYHIYSSTTGKSVRVLKEGARSGRISVIHNKLSDSRRGVGILAGIITELTKLADFQALEIQAAVINAMFAVWVETEINGDNKPVIKNNSLGSTNVTPESASRMSTSDYEAKLISTQFEKGGMIVQGMGEGQKLHSFDLRKQPKTT